MPIVSISDKSFVQFSAETLDCKGRSRQAALPAYEDFSISFQFKVEDELLPPGTVFKAAVCSEDCELLDNPDYEVIPMCSRFVLSGATAGALVASDFPITIGEYTPEPGQPQIPAGSYFLNDFINIINDTYDVLLPGSDYVSCCEEPVISGIIGTLNGEVTTDSISLTEYYYSGYINYPAENMDGIVLVDECFRYCILNEANTVLNCSNLFTRISNDCKTTVFRYWSDGNTYGFNYIGYDDLGVTRITENKIRLWVNFYQPGTPITENVIRQPDGSYERTSTIIEQQWRAQAAPLSTDQLFQLTAMLKHDNVYVINEEVGFDGLMTNIGEPEPDYQDGVRTPLTMVYFNMFEHSDTNVNSNCGGECGIALIPDCEGGGVVQPCPDKFDVEFQVSTGQTITNYQNDGLIGKTDLNIYREGIFQYKVSNDYIFVSGTGTVTFNPELIEFERVAIWEA